MSQVLTPPVSAPLPPGPLAGQAVAIAARLQSVFPPSLFKFAILPGKITKPVWDNLTTGNQPFLGLGFNGMVPDKGNGSTFQGKASWMLLVASRHNATPKDRYFGNAQYPGVTLFATTAVAILQGFDAETGSVTVSGCTNLSPDEWGGDSAIIGITLEVPLTLFVDEAIMPPTGLGLFAELAETYNWPVNTGSTDFVTSYWENPNV